MANQLSPLNPNLCIRRLREEEIPQAAALEREAGINAYGEAGYNKSLNHPDFLAIALIAPRLQEEQKSDATVLGIACGRIVLDEVEVDNVVVRSDLRRRGHARKLLQSLLATARARGCQQAFLEVRAGNTVARDLYLSTGFAEVGTRLGYYQNPSEHAVLMSLQLK